STRNVDSLICSLQNGAALAGYSGDNARRSRSESVEVVQLRGSSGVVAVRKEITERCVQAKLLGSTFRGPVDARPSGDQAQTHKDLIEELGVFSSTRSVECVEQTRVVEHVRYIEVVEAIQLDAPRSDVTNIGGQFASNLASHRQREVLDVRRHVIRIVC